MFDSRKDTPSEPKKIDEQGNEEQQPKKELKFKVHTMPQKFQSHKSSSGFETPTKKKSSTSKLVLIVVIVVVVLGLGTIGYLLLTRDTTDTANSNTNLENDNTNITLNFSTNRNTNANTNTNVNTNTNTTNSNTNTNTTNTNTATTKTLAELSLTQDLDGDLLTDAEEDSYGTNKTVKDTDEDTFDDATELVFGYSPLSKGKLEGSAAVEQYTNTSFGFSILYPKGWTTQARGTDGRGVLFFPSATSSGEFIEISVQDNFGRLTPEQWYRAQTSGTSTVQLETETNWDEEQTAVISPDGFSTFFGFGNYIFTIYYEVNDQDEINYKTTYEMLRKSIMFVAPVPATNTNSTSNANQNTNTVNSNSNTNGANQNTNIDVTTNVP